MNLADEYRRAMSDEVLHLWAAEAAAELRRLDEAHDWQHRMAGERLRRIEVLEAECEQLRNENTSLLDILWKSSGDNKEVVECYLHSVGLSLDTLYSREETK